MAEQVRDIMTPDPVCCVATESLQRVAQLLRDENIGSIPVVSDHQRKGLIGMVTDRDIVVRALADGRDITNTQVQLVMTPNTVTCHPDDNVEDVMELMGRNQLRRIPVVDANNQVVGIVAQADVALRADMPNKTAAVVEKISQPTGQR